MKATLKARVVETVPYLRNNHSDAKAKPPKGMEFVLFKDGEYERTYLIPKLPRGTVAVVKGVPVLKGTPKTWNWDKKTNTVTVEY